MLVAPALDGGDVAIAIDLDGIGQLFDPLLEIGDRTLLEARRAVQRNQLAQILANAVLGRLQVDHRLISVHCAAACR